jgi:16S rRNA (guanine527-N7)-methyltransferase
MSRPGLSTWENDGVTEEQQHQATPPAGGDPSIALHGESSDAALLAVLAESQQLGFLGPGPVAAHVTHASGFVSVVRTADEVLDLGSGGGLPGLVLARAFPDTRWVLLDAMERRCRFLERAVQQLGLDGRVEVECGRAEVLARREDLRGRFPLVVTRSFGAPAVTAECAAGFLRPSGGRLVVSEPPDSAADRWPAEGLARLSLRAVERVAGPGWTVQVLELHGELEERYPRRTGVPAKRPLF